MQFCDLHKSIQVKTSTFCINIDIELNEEFLGYRSIRNKSFLFAVLLSYFEIPQMNLPYAYLNFRAIDHVCIWFLCWCYTEHVYLSLSPWKTQNRCNALAINIGLIFMQAYPMWTEICWYILFIFDTWQEFATVKYFQLGLFTVCNVNTFNVITSVDISSGYERQLAAAHNVK